MKVAIAFVCLVVAICNAVSNPINIVPVGTEYVYTYNSTIFVGTREPEEFGSGYLMAANLHITGIKENIIALRLTDVLYKIFNDQFKLPVREAATPIPAEAEAVTYPFMVEFDPSGQIKILRFSPQDSEWSINMKKQIASLFQLNRQVLEENLIHSQSINVVENSIYGDCTVNYQIKPEGDNLMLNKLEDPSECKNNLHLKESSAFLSTDKGKFYSLTREEGSFKINSISAEGGLFVHPKGIKNENGILFVLQNLVFEKSGKSELEWMDSKDDVIISTLEFNNQIENCRDVPLKAMLDISGGRNIVDSKTLIEKLNTLLDDVTKYFDQNQVTLMKPEMKNVNLINRILAELQMADLPTLEQFFAILSEKTKSDVEMRKLMIFIELLPYIGTRPSAILIRNLIRKNKIDNKVVLERVLANLPDQVQCPTEKLLFELEDMLSFKDDNSTLYEVSLLSYASLIRRTFVDFDEKSATLEKYINLFAEKYQQTDDINQKILFLECLGNIEIGSVLKRMITLLREEKNIELRIKVLSIIMPRLQEDKNLLLTEVWSILANPANDVQLRIMAYVAYVHVKQPTANHFMKLYWLMDNEANERVFNFHYNTMKSFAKSPEFNEHTRQLADIANMVLRLSRKPIVKSMEGIYVMEKIDPTGYSGVRVEVMIFKDKKQGNAGFQVLRKLNGEVEEIVSLYGSCYNETLHITSHKNGRTLSISHLSIGSKDPENESFEKLMAMIGVGGVKSGNDTLETILIPMNFEKVIPTELGVPVKLYDRYSQLLQFQFFYTKLEDFELDFHINTVVTRSLGMKVFNPINNLWHGIQEQATTALNIPINGEMLDIEDFYRIVVKSKVDNKYILGVQNYVESQVFVENIKSEQDRKLLAVGDVSEYYVRIGREFAPLRNFTIYDYEMEEIGRRFKVAIFDCDRDISIGYIQRLMEKMKSKDKMSFLSLLQFQPSLLYDKGIGSCGIGIQLVPAENVDRLELDVGYARTPYIENQESYSRNETYTLSFRTISNENKTLEANKVILTAPLRQRHRNVELFADFYVSNANNISISSHLNATMHPDHFYALLELSMPTDDPGNVYEYSIHGMRSDEQKNTKNILSKQCKRELYNQNTYMPISSECYTADTYFRKYILEGKIRGGEKEKETFPDTLYEITFPILRKNELDVKSTVSKEFFEGIPSVLEGYNLERFLPPINQFFGVVPIEQVARLSRKSCIVGSEFLMKIDMIKQHQPLSDDWTLYHKIQMIYYNNTIEVSAKKAASKVKDAMAFRMANEGDVLECEPVVSGFDCKMNGTALADPAYNYIKDDYSMERFFTTNPHMLLINVHGMFVGYDGYSIRMNMEKYLAVDDEYNEDIIVSGLCAM